MFDSIETASALSDLVPPEPRQLSVVGIAFSSCIGLWKESLTLLTKEVRIGDVGPLKRVLDQKKESCVLLDMLVNIVDSLVH